jgi:excisionase family DNA binding protein
VLTLTEAAKETGLSRPAIFYAIKSGRLSATKDDRGQFLIDPAELFRVYKPLNKLNVKINNLNVKSIKVDQEETDNESAFLRREIELLRQQIARERNQVTREREQIADLKADRDHWRRQATMLLTHQPDTKPKPEQQVESLLLKKLFGKDRR